MKKTKLIAWIGLIVAIGTSIIRLYLLTGKSSFDVTIATIDTVTNTGYIIALLFIIWYTIRKYTLKKEVANKTDM